MKVTINEVKPIPPPKTYTIELSQEEMDLIRENIKYVRHAAGAYPTMYDGAWPREVGRLALDRFLSLTSKCSGKTYKPDVCFKDDK